MKRILLLLLLAALAACTSPTAPNAPPSGEDQEKPQRHTVGPAELDPCLMLVAGCEDADEAD
jgi:hypothetical protein